MKYKAEHIRRLGEEVHAKYKRLCDAFPNVDTNDLFVIVDGPSVRFAVDDLKAILLEIGMLVR